MPWIIGDPKPPKNGGNPFKEVDVKCNWCDDKMKGKNYHIHCRRKKHEYLSYKVLNVGFFNFRANCQKQTKLNNEVIEVNEDTSESETIIDDSPPTPAVQEAEGNGTNSLITRKRKRQPTLFESSWRKMEHFEEMIENLLQEVDDPKAHDYLQRLRQTLKEIDKAAIEIRAYREKKRQKYKDLMRLEATMSKLSKHNEDLQEQIRVKDSQYLATNEAGVESRVIAQEDIDRVVEHRKQVVNTLRAHPCFDISTDGKELICHFCVKNWEKAKLNFSERRGKTKISGVIGAHANRHVLMAKHSLCRRAEDSFQIHKKYYDDLYSSTQKRIASMTDNVIRVIYFIIKENIAMRKSERMFDLLDQCETPIGNQLHSRKTGAAIAMCIDETLQGKLIQWMFGKLPHSPDDIFVIADELTDVSGTKSCIVKTRTFEGMMLEEHLFMMIQSNGTSEDLAKKMQNSIIGDITRYVGLNRNDAVKSWNLMLKGVGSDRAAKMIKWGELMGDGSNAYHQYNCDNHITESGFSKLEEENVQVENVQSMVKAGHHSQVHSANRKAHLKKLADEYQQKYYTLQNVLDIKFATYNYDACLAFVKDFPMVMGLAKKLKDDSTVKPKKRSMMNRLFKHMKDGRNIINLIATVNVLAIISDYQKWGQLEKASAFERKIAVSKLKQKLKSLKEKHKAK